jgi:signal transduction histidine kinase
MPLPLKIKIRWGYVIAFLMLLISYFLIFFTIRKVANEANRISHSYSVINNLESIKAEITDAETGIRGYVITSDIRYLAPYNTGSRSVLSLYKELRTLSADNDRDKGKLDTLGTLINKRLAFMTDGLRQFRSGGFIISEEMKSSRESSKNTMDSIRLLVKQLQEKEHLLMKQRNIKLKSFFNSSEVIAITSLLVALITIIYSLIIYNRENKAKENSDARAGSYSYELEGRINELNRLNVELKELKSIEKFAATGRIARTIAHEVRNPLTNISLATEQLKEITAKEASEADVLLEMISRNAGRINQLVSELLNSTRFAQLEYSLANINQLLDESLEQAGDRLELKQVKVEKYYDQNAGGIMVDKEKMKLAFLNIIVNAIEAMEKGKGILQIKTHKQGNKCFIEFKDNGSGMDEETLQKLFEPYFTDKQEGNGLGLTNTQNIILNHGGNINVYSKKGIGSVFIITLNFKEE